MAKQKTRIMWWARDWDELNYYRLYKEKPYRCAEGRQWGRPGCVTLDCPVGVHEYTPSLKLRKGQCVQVKLTTLKYGVKMERIK